jgi:transposase
MLDKQIDELGERVMDHARQRAGAKLLMTHPGVGPVTALATDVFLGDPARFDDGKAVVSYVGMIPSEYSSGGRQRLGGLASKVIRCCVFSGVRPAYTQSAETPS